MNLINWLQTSFLVLIGVLTQSCTPCQCHQAGTSSLSITEGLSDTAEIDWTRCRYGATSGCLTGKNEGIPYRFGFETSPEKIIGVIGETRYSLLLQQQLTESYGNGIYELTYQGTNPDILIVINWNAKKQKQIGHNIVTP